MDEYLVEAGRHYIVTELGIVDPTTVQCEFIAWWLWNDPPVVSIDLDSDVSLRNLFYALEGVGALNAIAGFRHHLISDSVEYPTGG